MKKKVLVIGSGFSSLAAACYLAKHGCEVTILEKNKQIGGRARVWKKNGFTFDMGPSWYWMKEVFENFYQDFGFTTDDFYELIQLDPGFKMVFDTKFDNNNYYDINANLESVFALFETEELKYSNPDGIKNLQKVLADGAYTFEKAINQYLEKKSTSILEFADLEFISGVLKGGILQSYGKKVKSLFNNPHIQDILNFPVLFLGGKSEDIPYLYSLMAYTMLKGGTHYPMGGMHKIVEAMAHIAHSLGVTFVTNAEVLSLRTDNKTIHSLLVKDITTQNTIQNTEVDIQIPDISLESLTSLIGYENEQKVYTIDCDYVVNGGDYHHFDTTIVPPKLRVYSDKYWDSRVLAPSSLLAYIGFSQKIPHLTHHTLFFDTSLDQHGKEIYDTPQWPSNPLFYVCCPSKTDNSVAPEGKENVFLLMPLAPNLNDGNNEIQEQYFAKMLSRLGEFTQINNLESLIEVKRLYCVSDFKQDYHSFKGNAYGLANTLMQTAILKPKLTHPRLSNLVHCGQLTVPGPGVPPSLISGKLAASIVVDKSPDSM